jgi:hypothetical protein
MNPCKLGWNLPRHDISTWQEQSRNGRSEIVVEQIEFGLGNKSHDYPYDSTVTHLAELGLETS